MQLDLTPVKALKFKGARKGVDVDTKLVFEYKAEINGGSWSSEANIPLSFVPEGIDKFNAYGIRGEDSKNTRTYCSLFPVPGDGPDYHRIKDFGDLSNKL